jgi:D-arabinose 1-dehydrogenase-like Zn-dependent alcohol dehydrogenase
MTRPNGSYFVIGYGGTLEVPTLDIISTERNIIGNIVGTYNDLAELMVLAQTGKSDPAHQHCSARGRRRSPPGARRRPGSGSSHPRSLTPM